MAAEVSKQILCRFFEKGNCRDGEGCAFSHDSRAFRLPENACRFYLLNKCRFGDSCRFTHINVNSNMEITEESNNDSSTRAEYLDEPLIGEQGEANTSQYHEEIENLPFNYNDPPIYYINDEQPNINFVDRVEQQSDAQNLLLDEESQMKSYADVVKVDENCVDLSTQPLCQLAIDNYECPYRQECTLLHGEVCEYCDRPCLHPYNKELRDRHIDECILEHERNCEESFAIQKSEDKACGICMDVILKKEKESERRFGILEKCSHIFCLECIRKWRSTKQFENKTIRACPECRVASDFVIPHKFWIDSPEEKKQLISEYKKNLKTKHCRYFDQGRGECRFAGACFYLHQLPDGTIQELPQPRTRRRQNQYGNSEEIRDFFLYNYLEAREDRHFLLQLELENYIQEIFYSDSDYDDDIVNL